MKFEINFASKTGKCDKTFKLVTSREKFKIEVFAPKIGKNVNKFYNLRIAISPEYLK